MVKVALKISATVENVNILRTEGPDFQWYLKLQCKSCNETSDVWHGICSTEQVESKAGRGTFNYQMKCKFCSTVSTIDIVKDSCKPLESNENDIINNQIAVIFDCRGIEPIDFDPNRDGWVVKSNETGTEFTDVSFDENCWSDYDEKGKCSVSVSELNFEFVRS